MAVMTRSDLAKGIAPKLGVTIGDADRFVALVLDELKAMLMRGDEVAFKGFGRFAPVRQEGRIKRNPNNPLTPFTKGDGRAHHHSC